MKIKEKIGERRRMGEMRDEEEEEEEKKEEREGGREKIEISKRQTRGRTNKWMEGWDGITVTRRGGADAMVGIRV